MNKKIANGSAHVPKANFRNGKIKSKTPKAISKKIATTKVMMGIYLGKS